MSENKRTVSFKLGCLPLAFILGLFSILVALFAGYNPLEALGIGVIAGLGTLGFAMLVTLGFLAAIVVFLVVVFLVANSKGQK